MKVGRGLRATYPGMRKHPVWRTHPVMRGRRNGKYVAAVQVIQASPGLVITPAWLMERCQLDRKQADHVLEAAEDQGLVERVARGLYAVATPVSATLAGKVA